MTRYLSIEEIAQATGLEESVLRFYESEFAAELPPKYLQGDRLLFDPVAVDAFRRIHQRYLRQQDAFAPLSERYARVVAITSGKGGVGKSSLALNLAVELARAGKLCILFDADMGMANLHLMTGLAPARDLRDVLAGRCRLADCIAEGPEGVGLIAGGSGTVLLADSSREQRLRLLDALVEVEAQADFVLIDTGAGMGRAVRDVLLAADELLFVLTPDLTSLADAYGLLKAVHAEDPRSAPVHTVVNMAERVRQAAEVTSRFARCVERFLGRPVNHLGYLLKDSTAGAAIARRQPYCCYKPQARISRNTRAVAQRLLQLDDPDRRLSSAFRRYATMIEEVP